MFVVEIRNHHDVQKGQGRSTVACRFCRELTTESQPIKATMKFLRAL